MDLPTLSVKRWTEKVEETYTYRYLNGMSLRQGDDALLVNWSELTVTRLDEQVVYKNSFAMNHPLSGDNVAEMVHLLTFMLDGRELDIRPNTRELPY